MYNEYLELETGGRKLSSKFSPLRKTPRNFRNHFSNARNESELGRNWKKRLKIYLYRAMEKEKRRDKEIISHLRYTAMTSGALSCLGSVVLDG